MLLKINSLNRGLIFYPKILIDRLKFPNPNSSESNRRDYKKFNRYLVKTELMKGRIDIAHNDKPQNNVHPAKYYADP